MMFVDTSKTSSERMMEMLPSMYSKSRVMNILMEVRGAELDKLSFMMDDILLQFDINTATWSLPLWEQEYGLKVQDSRTYQERRSMVRAKVRKSGKTDAQLIQQVAGSYTNKPVEVSFKGLIDVKLIDAVGVNLGDIKQSLRKIIPAHLDFSLSLTHNRFIQIEQVYERWVYPFLRTNTFKCGTVPHQDTLGLWTDNDLNVEQAYGVQTWGYRFSGKVITGTDQEGETIVIDDSSEILLEGTNYSSTIDYQIAGTKTAQPKQVDLLNHENTLISEGTLQQSFSKVYRNTPELVAAKDTDQWIYQKSGQVVSGTEEEIKGLQIQSDNEIVIDDEHNNSESSYPLTGEIKTSKEVIE